MKVPSDKDQMVRAGGGTLNNRGIWPKRLKQSDGGRYVSPSLTDVLPGLGHAGGHSEKLGLIEQNEESIG